MPSAAVFVAMAVTVELEGGDEGKDTGMVGPKGLYSLREIGTELCFKFQVILQRKLKKIFFRIGYLIAIKEAF